MTEDNVFHVDFADILRAVKKRFYIVLLLVIPVTAFSIYMYVNEKVTPIYEAKASVIVGNTINNQNMQFHIEDVVRIQNYLYTYSALTKVTSISEKTVEKLNMNISAESIKNSIIATPQSNTPFIDLRLRWTEPDEAVKILDTFTEVYIEEAKKFYPAYNINIMERAKNSQVIFPSKSKRYIILGPVSGLIASLLIIFAVEFLNTRLKTRSEVEQILKLPIVGEIPKKKRKLKIISPETLKKMDNGFIEAFRIIKTNVCLNKNFEGLKTIALVSGEPGEGKTMAASMLATALAQGGNKTILIDCDLRRPNMHNIFNLAQIGLSQILGGGTKIIDVLNKSDIDNLWIITAGTTCQDPVRLFASPRMNYLMDTLKRDFDYIILDTPAAGLLADAQALSTFVDVYLLVVSLNQSKRDEVKKAKELIEYAGGKFIGVILNRVVDGYSRKNYKYYNC